MRLHTCHIAACWYLCVSVLAALFSSAPPALASTRDDAVRSYKNATYDELLECVRRDNNQYLTCLRRLKDLNPQRACQDFRVFTLDPSLQRVFRKSMELYKSCGDTEYYSFIKEQMLTGPEGRRNDFRDAYVDYLCRTEHEAMLDLPDVKQVIAPWIQQSITSGKGDTCVLGFACHYKERSLIPAIRNLENISADRRSNVNFLDAWRDDTLICLEDDQTVQKIKKELLSNNYEDFLRAAYTAKKSRSDLFLPELNRLLGDQTFTDEDERIADGPPRTAATVGDIAAWAIADILGLECILDPSRTDEAKSLKEKVLNHQAYDRKEYKYCGGYPTMRLSAEDLQFWRDLARKRMQEKKMTPLEELPIRPIPPEEDLNSDQYKGNPNKGRFGHITNRYEDNEKAVGKTAASRPPVCSGHSGGAALGGMALLALVGFAYFIRRSKRARKN